MIHAAVVAPRPIRRSFLAPAAQLAASKSTFQSQPKRTSPLASVPEQKNVAQEASAAEPKVETENCTPGEIPSIVMPVGAPVRVGRARSNSFYGRTQHTVLALRRSPSPPSSPSPVSSTSGASSSESGSCKSDESACHAQKTATFAPTSVPAALARTAQRLDLTLRTSATANASTSNLVGRSVAACLASSSRLQLSTRPTTALCISVSTTTTSTSAPASSPSPPRPAPLLPACPERTQVLRDSRCRLVAGLLLNRSTRAKQPSAAARAHRRAVWESASYAGVNGVRCSSGLRCEVAVC